MKSRIQKISAGGEIAIVVIVAFGLFVFASISAFVAAPGTIDDTLTGEGLASIVAFEIAVFAILLPFLRLRGWTWSAIGLRPTWRQTLVGIGIAVLAILLQAAINTALGVSENTVKTNFQPDAIPWPTFALLSIVNPLFEEIFVCGYLISALMERRGATFAIVASTLLRGVYHLYQGALSATLIGLLGLGFGYSYVRSGKLWPVIVAHGLLDFLALTALALSQQS